MTNPLEQVISTFINMRVRINLISKTTSDRQTDRQTDRQDRQSRCLNIQKLIEFPMQ